MKLRQVKVRGLPGLENTGWLPLHPQISLIDFPTPQQAQDFLAALEMINPVDRETPANPLRNYLKFTNLNGHTKRVDPQKKTATYGIFTADPQLVQDLAAINPMFYETDRVEVGRRLDSSRWISFVELPGSSKLAELERRGAPLFDALTDSQREEYTNLVTTWQVSDRISGLLADRLRQWWQTNIAASSKSRLAEECLQIINLEHETNMARKVFEEKMPLTILIDSTAALAPSYSPASMTEDNAVDPFMSFLTNIKDTLFPVSEKTRTERMATIASTRNMLDKKLHAPLLELTADKLTIRVKENSFSCINRILSYFILAKAARLQPPVFLVDVDNFKPPPEDTQKLYGLLAKLSASCQLIINPSAAEHDFAHDRHTKICLPEFTTT